MLDIRKSLFINKALYQVQAHTAISGLEELLVCGVLIEI